MFEQFCCFRINIVASKEFRLKTRGFKIASCLTRLIIEGVVLEMLKYDVIHANLTTVLISKFNSSALFNTENNFVFKQVARLSS